MEKADIELDDISPEDETLKKTKTKHHFHRKNSLDFRKYYQANLVSRFGCFFTCRGRGE